MDLRLPGLDGVDATRRIVAAGTGAVLVLTTYDSDGDILRAVEAGATGRGETVLAPPVAARLVGKVRGAIGPALTPRPEPRRMTGGRHEMLGPV